MESSRTVQKIETPNAGILPSSLAGTQSEKVGVFEMSQKEPRSWHTRSNIQPGDVGYIIYLHATLYAKEYGWDYTFEGYVAETLARFALSFDAHKDRLWVAEMDGQIVGSIGVVSESNSEAQLRWFLVHPSVRGHGLGRDLLDNALQFCRDCGLRSVFLWTVSDLKAAAHLYQSTGFHRTEQKTHQIWGKTLTEERYDLYL